MNRDGDDPRNLLDLCRSRHIFVFGSNLAGIHGAGAALHAAKYHQAENKVGEGLTGTSYAIPTKDENLMVRSLADIQKSVDRFLAFARFYEKLYVFEVTRIGCGFAGYSDAQIAPMFRHAPFNCHLPHGWREEYR